MKRLVLVAVALVGCGQSQRAEQRPPGLGGAAGSVQSAESGTAGEVTFGGVGSRAGSGGALGGAGNTGGVTTGGLGGANVIDEPGERVGEGGATFEWDMSYAQWPMPNPVGSGLPNLASYDTSVAGVVHDNVTGLDWQREVPAVMDWEHASQYCAGLTLAGRTNWRLPSRIELVSLVDYTRGLPSIDVEAFPDTPGEDFWTLTKGDSTVNSVWSVRFVYGKSDWIFASFEGRTRCVGADPPSGNLPPRYALTAATALDTGTGLMWERVLTLESDQLYTFDEAAGHCAALTLAGYADWRAPSIKELQTLVFEGKMLPALDPQAFPSATAEAYDYWSTSSHPELPGWANNVRFSDGVSELTRTDLSERVICVR